MEGRNPLAARWGALVARHRWIVLAVWLIAVIGLARFATSTPGRLSPSGFEADTEASRAASLLRTAFPAQRSAIAFVVLHSDSTPVTAPAYSAQVTTWTHRLRGAVRGQGVSVERPLIGRDGRTAGIMLESNRDPDSFVSLGGRINAISVAGPAQSYAGGFAVVYDDFVVDSERDLESAERISFPIALVLLLLVFGGVVAAGLPVLTGLATVTVAVALLGFVAGFQTVSIFSLNVSSIIGIGLGIDYSLLVVNRFREEMRSGSDPQEAVATTVGTAGVATVISGATVAIGFGALMLSGLNVLWSIGLGGALVVACSVAASLTLIPALLAVFGRHIDRLALPLTRDRDTAAFWHRLASGVMRRPVLVIVFCLAVVCVLLIPASRLRLGIEGVESLPPAAAARTAQTLAQEQLGLPAHSATFVIASGVHGRAEAIEVQRALQSAAGQQPVSGPAQLPPAEAARYLSGGHVLYELPQPGADNDPATRSWLSSLQAARVPPGVTLLVGGEAAGYADFLRALEADFPRVFATVLGCTLILLGIAFRSIILPIKAVVMNLLSVGAAMGVLTWGFQEGHLSRLLHFQPVGFVDATLPVVIFAALFGLSMDYEVFLLSRIRERWLRGDETRQAVAAGMERTGQIITSAALILVTVSMTLAFSRLALNKGLGVSFAVAILFDATIVRLLLVPAMMRLLSEANWWPARRR
ncbi:MAG TPA: MMPL family transporter [Candidatus Dormibacteraeota bacterium]|nr:MMPL family transporter [Candidatus Dormibacteraeota bacterium]